MNSKNTNESVASSRPVKHSVMMITDNSILLKILGKFIISKGYNYIPVLNQKTAPDSIKALKPDVILVYISMEDLDMLQVIDTIRNHQINIPIIVISDQLDKRSAVRLSNYNISGIFIKPFNLKKLGEKIRSLVCPKTSISLSLLIISDNEEIREDLDTFLPGNIIEEKNFNIILRSGVNDSVIALKKHQSGIKMVLVDASNEAKTVVLAQILKIIVTKLKIPVYFVAERFTRHFQDSLIKLGFINLVSRSDSSSKDLKNMFDSVLANIQEGTQTLATQERRNIIKDLKVIKTLPPLPEVYFKIEELARDKSATSADYSKYLELDPGITARLFRMSNSALFSFNRKIKSVKDAVTLMGTCEIVSLVRLACITGNLKVTPEIESAVKKVWQHSSTCAITAQLIYDRGDIEKDTEFRENLFIGGVIHDIGKIVLWKFFPDIYIPIMLNPEVGSHISVSDEKKFIGTSHVEVGRAIAEHWQLPETLKNVIAFHHNPTLKQESDLVMMIHIADIISNLIMNAITGDDSLGIDPEIEKIGYTEDKIRELASDLEVDIKEKSDLALRMITG